MSNFSFSNSIFKRLVLQTRNNQGLFGKGLKIGPGNLFGACYEWFGLTTEQRGELVDFYLAEKSVLQTKPACCNHFNVRGAPDRSTVWRIVKMLSVWFIPKFCNLVQR